MNSRVMGLVLALVLGTATQVRADARLVPGYRPSYPIPAPGTNVLPPSLFNNFGAPAYTTGRPIYSYPYGTSYGTAYPYGYGYGGYGGGVIYVNPPPVVVVNPPPVDTPQAAPAPAPAPAAPAEEAPLPNPTVAQVKLLVPADAEVFVQGAKMTQTGTVRRFVSPALEKDKEYTYQIRVVLHDKAGKEVVRNVSLEVRAGDSKAVQIVPPPANVAEAMPAPAPVAR
jgi:uncharacterized protein (TIGR03000 family)